MATNISTVGESTTQKSNEAVTIAAAGAGAGNQGAAVVNATATIINSAAGEKNVAEIHVHAQANKLQVNPIAEVVHIHPIPRNYPLLEKLKAKQMIEWEIPVLSNEFIGRGVLLKKLDEQISGKDLKQVQESNTFVVNALKGLGGIGKSALALHYIRTTKQTYTLKAWFQAENSIVLRQQYFGLAKELGFTGDKEEEGVAYLKRWFKEQPGWLLVFDNVNSAEEIKGFLPEGQGRVILTSRLDRWSNIYQSIAVPTMEEKEAIDLILSWIEGPKKTSCAKESQELSTLVTTLQMLPLALVQAGAYINTNDISAREYLELYQKSESKLLQMPAFEVTERTVANTWNISLQAIAKNKEMALGIDILCACAYLSPDNIPKGLLSTWMQAVHKLDKVAFNQCVEGLKRYSMIQADSTTLSIHRVAQTVIRHQQSGTIPTEAIPFPTLTPLWYGSLLKATNQEFNRDTHVLENEARQSALLVHLQALQVFFNANWEKELGADLGRILENISIVFFRRGMAREALQSFQKALQVKELLYGKEHLEVARTLVNLSNAYGDLGDTKQQKTLLEHALVIQERHYGKEHPDVALVLGNLGNAYRALGNAKQQKELLERALVIKERHYGNEHLEVSRTLVNLSNTSGDLGDTKQQKALLERALVIQEHHYGKEHPEVARILGNLGNVYGALGDAKEKKVLLERALAIQERHYGKEHPDVALALGNLGNAYGALGDVKQRKELLERALVIKERHYGKEHPEVAGTLGDLGTAYGALGDAKQEKALLERALAIQERQYGKEHPEVARTLGNLGNAYGALGDAKQKKELLERVLVIQEHHYGKEHPEVAITLVNLGNGHGDLGNVEQKKELLERALVIEERHYGKDHPEVAITLVNLGNAYGALGDAKQKKALLERALIIQERHYGKDHPQVAPTLASLGNAYGKLGDAKQEKALLERSLVIQERHYGKEHSEIAITLYNLALVNRDLNQLSQAQDQTSRAYHIFAKAYGAEHPHTLKAKELITSCQESLDKSAAASAITFSYPAGKEATELQKVLMRRKVDKDKGLPSVEVALRRSAAVGSKADAEFLIKHVKDINQQDDNQASRRTALHWAAKNKHKDVFDYLVSQGAKVDIKDAEGKTAEDYRKCAADVRNNVTGK